MSAVTAVLPELTLDGAERLSARISARLDGIADNYVAVMPLIREALNRNAHAVLGYVSPGAYIKDRFGDALGKLGIELRREVVRELSNAGMSTRAIAPVVGASHMTVSNDLAGVKPFTPAPLSDEPGTVPKLTGANSAAGAIDRDVAEAEASTAVPTANPFTGEIIDDPTTITETHTVKVVTGLDGKNYPTATKADRRRSLVDDAYRANTDLWKAIERVRTIRADDRFTRNKADILAALQPGADLATEVLNDLFK
jgi:hypothetical protein